ncbi:MAG: alpha/beta fold hydrolase, partial [Phycisphaerales bacterium]
RVCGVIAQAPYRMPRTPAENVLAQRGFDVPGVLGLALGVLGWRHGAGLTWKGSRAQPPFDRGALAAMVNAPLLVLHGDADEVVPAGDAESIASAAPRGTFVRIEGGGHNDLWTDPRFREQMESAIRVWLAGVLAR